MKKLIALQIAILIGQSAFTQVKSFSLTEAQAYAVENGYASKNAALDIESAQKEVKKTMAIGLPQISGSAQYQQFLDIPVQLVPAEFFNGEVGEFAAVQFGTEYNFTGSLTASQLIFDGSYIVALQASKTYLELSRNALIKTESEVKAVVASSYFTVLLASENIRILGESMTSLQQTLSETTALYEEGLTEEQDVDQLNINQLNIQNNIDNAQKQLEIAKKQLNFLLGLDLDLDLELTDDIESLSQLSNQPEYLLTEPNLLTHPDILIAKTNINVNELMLKKERYDYFPTLSMNLTTQRIAQRNEFNFFAEKPWYPTTIFGVTLNVPIFSSFMKKHEIHQAEVGLEKAQLQYKEAEDELKLAIERSRSEYDNAMRSYKTQEQSLQLAQKIRDKTMIKYKEGVSSSFELNVAERQLLSEQTNYINAAYNLLNAKQQLDKSLNLY